MKQETSEVTLENPCPLGRWEYVKSPNTLLVRLEPQCIEQEEDELMLSLFLDFLTKQAQLNPDDELEAYTMAMANEDEELIAGVEIDS